MIYGYARISTPSQNIERQIRNIYAAHGDANIYKEAYSGTVIARPKFVELLIKVKPGDTIVFDSVSRMSRNAAEGFDLYMKLFHEGINLEFIKEPHINTEKYKSVMERAIPKTNTKVDLILDGVNAFLEELAKEDIRLAFQLSQKEVDDIHKRTSEGIETARLNGKRIGTQLGDKFNVKKEAPAKEIIRKHCKEFGGIHTDPEVMKLAEISKNTFYKYKAELKAEINANASKNA